MADWTHPRIANPDCATDDIEDIAAEARAAYRRRRASYPDLVKAGRIPADEARADLAAWRAIAKDWHWIAYAEGEPATGDSLVDRMAALDTAIGRWLDIVNENGGVMSKAENAQGALLCAMRWWAERERPSMSAAQHIRDIAATNHALDRKFGRPPRTAAKSEEQERRAAA